MTKLELKNISVSYHGKKVINNFSYIINHGELIEIYGESGAGKTTLLNVIGQLQKIDSGMVIIDNIVMPCDISKCDKNFLRNQISYLLQDLSLVDSESIDFNLKIIKRYLSKENKNNFKSLVDDALRKVGLSSEYLDKKIYQLSGGEKQRVAIAKLIIKNVKLILADEPTASLDKNNRNEIMSILKNLSDNGATVIVVSHDEEIKSYFDSIIELKKIY